MDIHNSYDFLYQGCSLAILDWYGVYPKVCQLLTHYWDWVTMEARVRGYYGYPFQVSCGVNKVVPLSPHISNVVVDVIFRQWFGLVAENKTGPDGLGCMVVECGIFYTGDIIFASTDLVCIQWVFSVLINLFEKVRLRTYAENMVAIVCQPGPIYGRKSAADYGWWMTGEEGVHRVRQRQRVLCGECGT